MFDLQSCMEKLSLQDNSSTIFSILIKDYTFLLPESITVKEEHRTVGEKKGMTEKVPNISNLTHRPIAIVIVTENLDIIPYSSTIWKTLKLKKIKK